MTNARDIIIRPLVTEKTIKTEETQNTVVFEVAKKANKIAIKQAIEEIFKVKVLSVNTLNVKGKEKRMGVHKGYTAARKKAVVRLTEESKPIEIFEGMV